MGIPNPDLCPFYQLRLVEGVTIRQSPVMDAPPPARCGRPPHFQHRGRYQLYFDGAGAAAACFDRDKLEGGRTEISVARDGGRIVTLGGQERVLTSADLLIRDGMKPVALAGVMGGLDTGNFRRQPQRHGRERGVPP